MSALISLKALSVTFDDKKVLDSISLDLHKGKITTLIGPNGAASQP